MMTMTATEEAEAVEAEVAAVAMPEQRQMRRKERLMNLRKKNFFQNINRASTPLRDSLFHSAIGETTAASTIPLTPTNAMTRQTPMIPTSSLASTPAMAPTTPMLPPPPPPPPPPSSSIPIPSYHPIPSTSRRQVGPSFIPTRNIPFKIRQVENKATILCPICQNGYKKFKFLKTHLQKIHDFQLEEVEANRGRNLLKTANDHILSILAANQNATTTSVNRKRKNQLDNQVAKSRAIDTQTDDATPSTVNRQQTPSSLTINQQKKRTFPIFKYGKRNRNDKIGTAMKKKRTKAPPVRYQTFKYVKRRRNDKIGSAPKRRALDDEEEEDTTTTNVNLKITTRKNFENEANC